jgi:hypothetical protein
VILYTKYTGWCQNDFNVYAQATRFCLKKSPATSSPAWTPSGSSGPWGCGAPLAGTTVTRLWPFRLFLQPVLFCSRSHLLLLWPGAVVLHFTGVEPFSTPTRMQLQGLGVNVVLALATNLLSTHAMNLTTPVFSGAGMALTIPASVFADVVLHGGAVSSATQWAGMLGILGGFLGLVASSDDRAAAAVKPKESGA